MFFKKSIRLRKASKSLTLFHRLNRQMSYRMPMASFENNMIVISDKAFDEARRAGFFELKLPENLYPMLSELRRFSREFYKDPCDDHSELDHYRGFNRLFNQQYAFARKAVEEGYMIDNHKGLKDTQDNQVERFSLKKAPPDINHWRDFYPQKICEAAEALNQIACRVLFKTMTYLDIPRSLWSQATGRSIEAEGTHYLLFNYYRPEINKRGLKAHQDWSNVTLLCLDEKEYSRHALEAYIDGKWHRIAPTSDYHLIVNFGITLELLTQYFPEPLQVNAAVHRVVQQNMARSSSVFFADHAFSTPIYALSPNKQALEMLHSDFSEFVIHASKRVYDDLDEIWGEKEQANLTP